MYVHMYMTMRKYTYCGNTYTTKTDYIYTIYVHVDDLN